jgi:predicted RNA-binding protein YlqC (UPF0109 family)
VPKIIAIRNAVDGIVRTLVDIPEAVVIQVTRGESSSALNIHTSAEDKGKVIGKQGRTMKSLRVLVQAASQKAQTVVTVDVCQ